MEQSIYSYCKISHNEVWVNGDLFFKGEPAELSLFLGKLYKHLELSYPKFFKMDKLSKLGVLATELVIRNASGFSELPKNEVALIFANTAASLDSDRNHQSAISDKQNYFPSPSVFVYTLPNIVMGEIAIKHKLTGENAFFVSEHFNGEQLCSYSTILLQSKFTSAAICGWVNVDENKNEAFVYCVKKANFKLEKVGFSAAHSPLSIDQLYQS